MAKKYHIGRDGKIRECVAKGKCPLGENALHFETKRDAQDHIDKLNEEYHGLLAVTTSGYNTKEEIKSRLSEHYQFVKERVDGEMVAVFLQGSQNYIDDMFHESSDVDSRAIFLPDKKSLFLGQDLSKPDAVLPNKELIGRFDVRKYLSSLKRPGINNYESLFTEYRVVNPKYKKFYEDLQEIRESVVRIDEKGFLMSLMGIGGRDYKVLEKSHGGQEFDIENFGYSRKRLANILRFNKTAKAYIENKPFKECLQAMDQEEIYEIRRTHYYSVPDKHQIPYYSHERALELAQAAHEETTKLAKEFQAKRRDTVTEEKLEDIFVSLLDKSLK